MTRQILFVQGGGEGAHDGWDIRLVESLRAGLPGDQIVYPKMPDESDPSYRSWKAALDGEFSRLRDGDVIVAHSIGATILVNALAETAPPFTPAGIFLLAAPFAGAGGWPPDGFTEREHLGADLPPGVPIAFYHGTADETAPVSHLDLYAKAIPQAVIRRLEGRDHQLNDDLREVAADIRSL